MNEINEEYKNYFKQRMMESLLVEAANPSEPSADIGGILGRIFGGGKKPKKPLSPVNPRPNRPPSGITQNFIDHGYAMKHFRVANLHLLQYKEITTSNGVVLRLFRTGTQGPWKMVYDPTKPPIKINPRFDPNNPAHVQYVQEHGIGGFINPNDWPSGVIPPALLPALIEPSDEVDVTSEEIPGSEGVEATAPYRMS